MTKLYVAGPMTGLVDYNFPTFLRAAKLLRDRGFEVINPAEIEMAECVEDRLWKDCLVRDIEHLVRCDGVALLDNWWKSKGARLEVHVATELEMQIEPVGFWLEHGPENAALQRARPAGANLPPPGQR